jgi:xyloglucan-specific endo-beta-1,4-glucanase
MGKYYLFNNLWGDNGQGWQCMWNSFQSGDTIGWGTNYSWAGANNTVKSYTSVVLGWHWGWDRTGTELPVQVSANRTVTTSYNYNIGSDGAKNVAYDLWLHTINNPTWEHNPSDEVMIWLYRSGGVSPVGSPQATVTIAGSTWELWRGNVGWEVYSFVRTSTSTSGTINLRDFLNHLVSRGWLSSSKYLTSVEFGTEAFVGTAQLDVNSYSVDVQ